MPEPKKTTTPAPGETVQYWPEQKPFVGRGPYPATVAGAAEGGKLRLVVENPHTGRTFLVDAALSTEPASGACVAVESKAAPSKPPASPPVRVTTTVTGSGGGP